MSGKAFGRQWAALRDQVQANPRLRWALPVITLLLVAVLWQGLEGLRNRTQKHAIAEEANLRRIRALEGQVVWFERADEAGKLLASLQSEIPEANTPGLAQAATQTWLRGIANAAAAPDAIRVTVESSSPVEELPGILRVKATVSGGIPSRQALNVIRQIEDSSNLAVIETATIRSDQNDLFTLSMNAYYRLPPGAGTATDAGIAP